MDQHDLYREIQPFLSSDETVLWTGRPGKIPLAPNTGFLAVFAIFWMGFAVFWTITATSIGGPFGLFGIAFIFFGGFMFYSIFFGKRNLLKNAVYAVTDRRAIILTYNRNGMDCTEYVFSKLRSVNLESVNGNTGTIRFTEECIYTDYGNELFRRRSVTSKSIRESAVTAFFMIDGVHEVYRLICEQKENG